VAFAVASAAVGTYNESEVVFMVLLQPTDSMVSEEIANMTKNILPDKLLIFTRKYISYIIQYLKVLMELAETFSSPFVGFVRARFMPKELTT
jgi:hypothetical protein